MATYGQLVQALQDAHRGGHTEAAMKISAAIENREYDEEMAGAHSVLQKGLQGASMGLSDEAMAGARAGVVDPIIGGVSAAFNFGPDYKPSEGPDTALNRLNDYIKQHTAWGNKSIGEGYTQALDTQRDVLETAGREDPALSLIGELGGGLATGGVGAGKAIAGAAGKGVLANIKRGVATGGGLGALAGFGYSEGDPVMTAVTELAKETPVDVNTILSELSETTTDVGVGAGLGGAFGLAAPVLGATLKKIGTSFAGTFQKGEEAIIKENARQVLLNEFMKDVENGTITPQKALEELKNTKGMTLADVSPEMVNALEALATTPTGAGHRVDAFYTQRNEEQFARIMPTLYKALNTKNDRFAQAQTDILTDIQTKGRQLFGATDPMPVRVTGEMFDLIHNPVLRRALTDTNDLRQLDGMAPFRLTNDPDGVNLPEIGDIVTTQELHQILRGMDAMTTQAYKSGSGAAAKIGEKRDQFREALFAANPELRNARRVYRGAKENNEALEMGEALFRDDADLTLQNIRNMSQAEKVHFRVGALRAITRRLGDKSDTADIIKGTFNSPNKRAAIRVAFGSKKKFEEFMAGINQESKMFDVYNKAIKNSRTAKRMMNADGMGKRIASIAGYAGTMGMGGNLPPSIGGYLAGTAYKTLFPEGKVTNLDRKRADAIMELLTSGGGGPFGSPADNAINKLMTPTTVSGLLQQGPGQVAGGLLGTSLASGLLTDPDQQ